MAFMVMQRYTTAVKRGYRANADAGAHGATAADFRRWLESLDIEAGIRAELVEIARALENGFAEAAVG